MRCCHAGAVVSCAQIVYNAAFDRYVLLFHADTPKFEYQGVGVAFAQDVTGACPPSFPGPPWLQPPMQRHRITEGSRTGQILHVMHESQPWYVEKHGGRQRKPGSRRGF